MYAAVARLKTAQKNVLRHVDELNNCKKKKKKAWIQEVVCYVHGEGEQAAPKQKYQLWLVIIYLWQCLRETVCISCPLKVGGTEMQREQTL